MTAEAIALDAMSYIGTLEEQLDVATASIVALLGVLAVQDGLITRLVAGKAAADAARQTAEEAGQLLREEQQRFTRHVVAA